MSRHPGLLALRLVGIAGAYFVAGRLSQLLTIPNDYAVAAWPPAGLAMGAAILWGPAILPGVFVGALGVNLANSGEPLAAASIALGAVLQAAAGAWIARRLSGPGNPLDSGRSPLSMLFWVGPVSCIVSPTWGVATLIVAGVPTMEHPGLAWATWWVGDTIGVLVFLPMILAWTARPAEIWRVRRWTLTVPLLVCFFLVVLLSVYSRGVEERRTETEFEDHQRPVGTAIVREMERARASVVSLASLFRASEKVERQEFAVFARETMSPRSGLLSLEWSPIVLGEQRASFETRTRADGIAGFSIRDVGFDGAFVPAADRARHVPVLYVEPADGNERSVGFDLESEDVRRAGIDAAIRRAAPTVTGRLRIMRAPDAGWGVLLLVPVYRTTDAPATSEERTASIQGLAFGVLRLDDLVDHALRDLDPTGLAIRVRDVSGAPESELLYGEETRGPEPLLQKHTWSEAGRDWDVEIAATAPAKRPWTVWFVLAGGLLFTAIFGAFSLELATRHIHVERLVAVRTRELARANDELQRSNLELQRFAHVASHDLREPLRAIGSYAQLLDESAIELEPEHRKFLERVVAASRRMQALVDDLLALSRLEGGATAMSEVALEKLVGFARENLQPAIDAAGAHLEVAPLPTVRCDPSQIVQLLQNLISNAVKFRRQGVPPVVRIDCRRAGPHWEIAVKDNGIGIAPEHHARVFEMFERLHARERYGGTGIGLAICRRIVDRHGGRIWLESPAEGGSVFRFTLRAEGESG